MSFSQKFSGGLNSAIRVSKLAVAMTTAFFPALLIAQSPPQLTLLDPVPTLLSGPMVTTNVNTLATKGRVVQGNFDDYTPLRMDETPVVEVYAVPSTEVPTGIGEPSVPPVAPALCNAIYAATKKRIRALPILS